MVVAVAGPTTMPTVTTDNPETVINYCFLRCCTTHRLGVVDVSLVVAVTGRQSPSSSRSLDWWIVRATSVAISIVAISSFFDRSSHCHVQHLGSIDVMSVYNVSLKQRRDSYFNIAGKSPTKCAHEVVVTHEEVDVLEKERE